MKESEDIRAAMCQKCWVNKVLIFLSFIYGLTDKRAPINMYAWQKLSQHVS